MSVAEQDLSSGMIHPSEFEVAGFMQEVFVLGVFFLSFVMWRQVKERPSKSKLANLFEAPSAKNIDTTPDARSPIGAVRKLMTNAPPHGLRVSEQLMMKHLEQREFTRALNMYRTLERDGSDRFLSELSFSSFIQSAVRVGKLDVVDRMLRTMRKHKMRPSQLFWHSTLKMLSSRKHFSTCLTAYALWEKQMPCDKVIFSCLINASLEIGAPERAASMLERYAESDVETKDYVLFFRTYVALGDADNAEARFRMLGEECTPLMLNLLLLTCVNVKDPPRAHKLLREAHCIEDAAPEGTLNMVDVVSYNTVIKGYGQASEPTKCLECLHEMLERKLEPDEITFGTLLDACIVDNDVDAANELVSLLAGQNRPMDTVLCTLFIKGLVRANRLPKALELYQEMRRRDGSHPDVVTYSVLIKALVDQHNLDQAISLLGDMRQVDLEADDIILTHLLDGCRHEAQHGLGKQLFEEIVATGVKPSEFTLVTMLKLHGRCGAYEDACDLVKTWENKYGVKPSVIHYTCIMSGCLRIKHYDRAWEIYELMCENGVLPDGTTINTLLPGLVAAKQWDRVLILVRRALTSTERITIAPEILNNALSQMVCHGDQPALDGSLPPLKFAEQLRRLMTDANVPITMRNLKRVA